VAKTYRSAAAFKAALEERMRKRAAERGVPLNTLQLEVFWNGLSLGRE
jgi:hypothetical protein